MQFSELLDLEHLDQNLFRSRNTINNSGGTLYGGGILGQALLSACQTAPEDRQVHSMHGYFLRGGSDEMPVIYDVDAPRDGGSFSTRRVMARQKGHSIFGLSASFHIREPGHAHAVKIDDGLPDPESLPAFEELLEQYRDDPRVEQLKQSSDILDMLDLRPLNPEDFYFSSGQGNTLSFWVRTREALATPQCIHRCVLAFMSDIALVSSMLLPMPNFSGHSDSGIMAASLDHAMWFHNDVKADDWLFFKHKSDWAGNARGLARSRVFNRDGVVVASAAQEGLIRPIDKQRIKNGA